MATHRTRSALLSAAARAPHDSAQPGLFGDAAPAVLVLGAPPLSRTHDWRRTAKARRAVCADLFQPREDKGRSVTIYGSNGQRIAAVGYIVELASLIVSHRPDGTVNPAYPAEMQPRDRSSGASMAQIQGIAGNLEPERLALAADASVGAPIVGPDMVAESGNGRLAALALVYGEPSLSGKAARYRAFLGARGYDVRGYSRPVLVALRITQLAHAERRALALAANERSTLAMSAAERARADVGRVAKVLDLWRGGDVADAANRDFVRGFLAQLSAEERGGLVADLGALSADGERRITSAILAAAYGDALGATLDRFLNASADGMKAIAGALQDTAGRWAQLRAAVAGEMAPAGADITGDLAAAVQMVEQARRIGLRVCDLAAQSDFDRAPLSVPGAALLRLFFRDAAMTQARGRAKVADGLLRYVRECLTAGAGAGLFGEASSVPVILEAAIKCATEAMEATQANWVSMMHAKAAYRNGNGDGYGRDSRKPGIVDRRRQPDRTGATWLRLAVRRSA